MVAQTTPLKSLKNLLPKLHQPLPLNNRESRQLLESITNSFRKNLDEEHPWEASKDDSISQKTSHIKQDPLLLKSSISPSLKRPTERHLHAILSHPLFTHQEPPKPKAALDPFYVFDTAVSKGLMTPSRAAGFLAKVQYQIKAGHHENEQEAMAKSGAGLRVVRWMRTSGLENNLQSLCMPGVPFFWPLVPFLYAEGLEELVWTWVARLGSEMDVANEKNASAKALYLLLKAINRQNDPPHPSRNLDIAYKGMLRAYDILQPEKNPSTFSSYRRAWENVSFCSTVLASRYTKPSVPIFDAFVDAGRSLKTPINIAHLKLHHPTTPDHSAAVEFIHRRFDTAENFINDVSKFKRFVCLALDTTNRLKEVGDIEEISWIERLLMRLTKDLNSYVMNTRDDDLEGLHFRA